MSAAPAPAGGGDSFTPSRFSWEHLDREAAAALWAELIAWTTWLRRTYELHDKIPPCWFAHDAIREELTALMVAHKAAYADHGEDTDYWSDPAAWHAYYLPPFISRIRGMVDTSTCRGGHCGYVAPEVTTLESVHEYVAADVGERPAPTQSPAQAEPARPTETLDPKTVRGAVADGGADLVDPSDPFSDVEYAGRRWRFDDTHNTYVPID